MKYDKQKTLVHEVADEFEECIVILDELIEDEGYSGPLPVFGVEVEVIEMDCVEAKLASSESRKRLKSMDCAFVVSDGKQDEVVFAEFRFNYENLSNLSRSSLIGKVQGSTNAIGSSMPIRQDFAFIFESSILQQARSRFARMNPIPPNNYKVYDIQKLKQIYF